MKPKKSAPKPKPKRPAQAAAIADVGAAPSAAADAADAAHLWRRRASAGLGAGNLNAEADDLLEADDDIETDDEPDGAGSEAEEEAAVREAALAAADDPVRMYLREIGRGDLLTGEQELWLALQVSAEHWFAKIKAEGVDGRGPAASDKVLLLRLWASITAQWNELAAERKRAQGPPLRIADVLAEATNLRSGPRLPERSMVRAWLHNGRWGSDPAWDAVAKSLLYVLRGLYLLPLNVRVELASKLKRASKLPTAEVLAAMLPTRGVVLWDTAEVQRRSEQATDTMVRSNLRLVVSVAKRYFASGISMLDLIQEGNIGLMKGVKKYDPARGFRLSTYATWWIRQSITRSIADQARTIRIPVHMTEAINRINRARRALTQQLGRDPRVEELALDSEEFTPAEKDAVRDAWAHKGIMEPGLMHKLDLAARKISKTIQLTEETLSLDTPTGDKDAGGEFGDTLADERVPTVNDQAVESNMRDAMRQSLGALLDSERKVIDMRYGLTDGKARTLEDVGATLGLTRERVRQIEAKALRKLRNPSRSGGLREHLT